MDSEGVVSKVLNRLERTGVQIIQADHGRPSDKRNSHRCGPRNPALPVTTDVVMPLPP